MRFPRFRRLAAVTGLVVATLAVLALLLWPSPPPATWDGLSTLPPGDTRADVYAKLGGPPGDYRRGGFVGSAPGLPSAHDLTTAETWSCDEGVVHVWFDADGRLKDVLGRPSNDFRPTPLQRIKQTLGL